MTRPVSEALAEVFARIKEIADTPEYQAHAARLAAEDAEREAARIEEATKARILKTGVPPEVTKGATFSTPAMVAAEEFMAAPPALRFLMLGGKAGNGKTYALASMVWKHGGRYLDAQSLVSTGTFGEGADEWDRLAYCNVLAVDELGAEATNSAFEANLYALLDRRYRTGKRTILATNLNVPEFKARFCASGLDRLLDRVGTGGRWVSLTGASMRRNWQDTDEREAAP